MARVFQKGRSKRDDPSPNDNNDDNNDDDDTTQQSESTTTPAVEETSSSTTTTSTTSTTSSTTSTTTMKSPTSKPTKHVSVCIVGGGVSGLTASIKCAQELSTNETGQDDDSESSESSSSSSIVLLEADSNVGGRVQSDTTDDGYTLDRGFAVFIQEYPQAKMLLNYTDLKLGQFLPGALVKIDTPSLARVADPLRQPKELWTALLAPVGTFWDKLRILVLVVHVRLLSISELFTETETNTLTALEERWNFSKEIIEKFFTPFLEGIYLSPLPEQSSRMFSFVFKMFSEGAAALPHGGIGAVAQQLQKQAQMDGVDIQLQQAVQTIKVNQNALMNHENQFTIQTTNGDTWTADSLIIATDGVVACQLISQINGLESLESLPSQVQRSVGNLYYGFPGEAPVQDPILILNGMGPQERGNEAYPVNNVCFPSLVTSGYAPDGYNLCSVTVLKDAMDQFVGRDAELDVAVRNQLATWFPKQATAICDPDTWQLKGLYRIDKAQPGQYQGPFPANVHGGRPCNTYRNKPLPAGLFVCGDHMSTATLNGALESGVAAGTAAATTAAATAAAAAATVIAK